MIIHLGIINKKGSQQNRQKGNKLLDNINN